MALSYNPVVDSFITFEAVETPRVEINLPLLDNSLDISDWSSRVTENGTPIVQNNLRNPMTNNNPITNNPESSSKQENVSTPATIQPEANQNVKGDKKKAMNFFLAKGLQPHIAAGIVGNLIHESGLNTSAKGDKGSALGLAQWRLDRRTGLENFAKSRGKNVSDFETQLEWVWQELNSGYKNTLDKLNQSSNVGQATKIFMDNYERPNVKYANFSSRLKHAESLLN